MAGRDRTGASGITTPNARPLHHGHHATRTTGFEPATSRATSERSTTELRPRELRGQESNLLSRAHEARGIPFPHRASFMWPAGFEPATPRASSGRSTGLSYSHVELLSRFSVPLSHPSALDRRPTWRGVGARCRRVSASGPFSLGRGLGQSVVFFKLGITCVWFRSSKWSWNEKGRPLGRPRSCGSDAHGPLSASTSERGRGRSRWGAADPASGMRRRRSSRASCANRCRGGKPSDYRT